MAPWEKNLAEGGRSALVVKTKLPNHFIIYGFVKTLLRVEEREAHRVKLVGLISNAVVTIPQER